MRSRGTVQVLTSACFGTIAPVSGSSRNGPPERVLVVRLGAIGDVTNALVFAAALKDAHPATRIGWVVHPLAAPLVEGHPCVDRVHLWRKGGGPAELRRVLREVRGERYDLAVDLQRITKSALLARLSGARRVLGYDRGRAKELSWLWTKERIAPGPLETHMVEHYLAFAHHLGLERADARHVLPVDAEAEAWAEAKLAELGAAPVIVNLGATKEANRWLPERFGELALALHETLGAPVLLTGSEADRPVEAAALAALGDHVSGAGVESTVGGTDLPRLISLLRRARLFVGCDTGPMHLAGAVGTPVVALFGPADPRRTGPWRTGDRGEDRVVRVPPPCAPCNRKTCNQPRHACMEDLTVALVVAEAEARLARPAQSSR
jgi:lipopolysaccharide heptosyltransferase II